MIRCRLAAAALVVVAAAAGCSSSHSSAHPPSGRPASPSFPTRPAPAAVAARSTPLADVDYPSIGTTTIDALHYRLNLSWDATHRMLTGTEQLQFRVLHPESAISVDFGAPLTATHVTLGGESRPFTHPGHKLDVTTGRLVPDQLYVLALRYRGHPAPVPAPTTRKDIPDLGWTTEPDGQAWSVQEPYGAFTWYAVNDHPSDKALYDITWHVRRGWTGVSNGDVTRDVVSHGQHVTSFHMTEPAASYLIAMAVGPYQAHHQTGPNGLPMTMWVRPVDKSALDAWPQTPAVLAWLEGLLGPYPFDRLDILVSPTTSSVETQTMVTAGVNVLRLPYGLSTMSHEFSHQWYGDTVTPDNWKDLWLNESFAMYIQIRWSIAHGQGTSTYWHRQLDNSDQHLRTKYGPPGDYDPKQFASTNVYFCGARMLYRLESMLGDATFDKVLRDWPQAHRYGNANRAEWIAYLDQQSGKHLDGFVTTWLNSPTTPA